MGPWFSWQTQRRIRSDRIIQETLWIRITFKIVLPFTFQLANYYFNNDHGIYSNTYLYPASGSSGSQIKSDVSDGAAYVNYTAHGYEQGWADPSFTNSDVNNLTNNGKYPLMVGNCCLTNAFDTGECFGEALLRAQNKGAVGYIGGSDVTHWNYNQKAAELP